MFQGAHDATNFEHNPFWIYSLKQYQTEECAQFLLAAQDNWNLDINLLLYIGWLSSQEKHPSLSNALTYSKTWQAHVVKPIRTLRRRIKQQAQAKNSTQWYQVVKQLELAAEQRQQAWLYLESLKWPKHICGFDECFRKMMTEYLKQEGIAQSKEWLQALKEYLQPQAET